MGDPALFPLQLLFGVVFENRARDTLGVPTASERGAESEVAHKWARWLHNPCRLGGPHRFRAGGRIGGGPQVGKVAT